MEDRVGPLALERSRRRGRRLDGPDAAGEPGMPAELRLGGRDEENAHDRFSSRNTGWRDASASHSSSDEARVASKNGRVTCASS